YPAPTETPPLSLHDALPISVHQSSARETIVRSSTRSTPWRKRSPSGAAVFLYSTAISQGRPGSYGATALRSLSACLAPCSISARSEEHTSELQSRGHLVCRL